MTEDNKTEGGETRTAADQPRPDISGMQWASAGHPAISLCFVADALYRIAEAIRGNP